MTTVEIVATSPLIEPYRAELAGMGLAVTAREAARGNNLAALSVLMFGAFSSAPSEQTRKAFMRSLDAYFAEVQRMHVETDDLFAAVAAGRF